MYNNEKKDDFQNPQDDWCEEWIEDWHEVWYDEASLDINQTPQDDYEDKSKSNFIHYVDELETALDPHINVSESSQEPYNEVNSSLDVDISMD